VFDEVFFGKGYQAEFIHRYHRASLCVPLEVKKVFMEENTGDLHDEIFADLQRQLQAVLTTNSALFISDFVCSTRA
jgi:hypothetical protein